jgi:hypothetical protein
VCYSWKMALDVGVDATLDDIQDEGLESRRPKLITEGQPWLYTHFMRYDGPWVCCFGTGMDWCKVAYCRLSKIEQEWHPIHRQSRCPQNQHSTLGPQYAYRYFSENTSSLVLFKALASIHFWNLIKIAEALFEKFAILCVGAHLKVP